MDNRLISYPMAVGMYKYLEALLGSGVLVTGELGDNDLAPNLKPLVAGIHHVLAGGTVQVNIVDKGAAARVQMYDDLLKAGTESANELNEAAGFYLSIAP